MITKPTKIKRFIGVSYNVGVCNMNCSYCYVGSKQGKLQEIPWDIEIIRRAYSKKRLGGICFINICADGEPLIHPMIPEIIKAHLEEGHYVSVVTNGSSYAALKKILSFDEVLLKRLFFKISFHYEELLKMKMLDMVFKNIEMIKNSPCSFTVEYITTDEMLSDEQGMREMKKLCLDQFGALPHLNMPRDERRVNLGLQSKYSWDSYIKRCENLDFRSSFFEFRKQIFGKKYKNFCYSGIRHLWIDMRTGYSYQCYDLPKLQDFMGQYDKPVKFLAVGENCPQAHCYVAYTFMTLGIAEPPQYATYKPSYYDIRNRICKDGTEWIKPTYKEAFSMGVEQKGFGVLGKRLNKIENKFLHWIGRK